MNQYKEYRDWDDKDNPKAPWQSEDGECLVGRSWWTGEKVENNGTCHNEGYWSHSYNNAWCNDPWDKHLEWKLCYSGSSFGIFKLSKACKILQWIRPYAKDCVTAESCCIYQPQHFLLNLKQSRQVQQFLNLTPAIIINSNETSRNCIWIKTGEAMWWSKYTLNNEVPVVQQKLQEHTIVLTISNPFSSLPYAP